VGGWVGGGFHCTSKSCVPKLHPEGFVRLPGEFASLLFMRVKQRRSRANNSTSFGTKKIAMYQGKTVPQPMSKKKIILLLLLVHSL
jgi:hypothetical protein